jgi:hypothetical protein
MASCISLVGLVTVSLRKSIFIILFTWYSLRFRAKLMHNADLRASID